ncbi:hypothetical protein NBT05_03865 [Aquimarina sp. ERC-38]|uniref:hypothetical protein n=1 Tax=Aquimarina sp. ERC-38 TaxID=2949996 RepID=UPI002246DA72|nr:hypothetical protein [Aquimarina sp. ERC-38]UZO81618.1 hypothetical protein NBT05_03865 [Aquimarina sp. ERC-38]
MFKKQQEQAEILMEIPEELLEELTQEKPEIEEEKIQEQEITANKRTHNAYNQDFENHDDIEKRIKSLTDAPESTEESTETEEALEGEESIEEDLNTEETEAVNPSEDLNAKVANNRNSSVTFNLKNRRQKRIPNPIYTCSASGKVVVLITVNQNGYVSETKIDKKKSSTRNECLFENALKYAQKAMFSESALKLQNGSITYYFNYGG